MAENGIDNVLELVGSRCPTCIRRELSLFVLEAGVQAAGAAQARLMYLSLTDYMQHKYAPGEPEARSYYRNMDALFGKLDALGAVVALTADHGMNDKSTPTVAQRHLAAGHPRPRFGKGTTIVICPITDYFVAHHGALGGFVRVYCNGRP